MPLGFNLKYIATQLNARSAAFEGFPVITETTELVAQQVNSATEFAMSATGIPTHTQRKGKGRKGKGKGKSRQNDGNSGNILRGTGRVADSKGNDNSALVMRKRENPFLRALGTTGRQEL